MLRGTAHMHRINVTGRANAEIKQCTNKIVECVDSEPVDRNIHAEGKVRTFLILSLCDVLVFVH